MPQAVGTQRRREREGLITGYVFKLVRESVGLTQERLAEALRVDPHTIQGWESSRRPLTAASAGTFAHLRRQLRSLGADAEVLESLGLAVDADYLLTYALSTQPEELSTPRHPLARWVLPRETSEMLAWAVSGDAPERVRQQVLSSRRRGPVAEGPILSPNERAVFVEHFRAAAERSLEDGDPVGTEALLLRRQAYYQLARADDAAVGGWLQAVERREEQRLPRRFDRWTPAWVAARSLAVAQARCGNRDALRNFIARGFDSDECQQANLHYWAYWVGEAGPAVDGDSFMVDPAPPGTMERLARRLHPGLTPDNPCLDLYAHSLWAICRGPGGSDMAARDAELRGRLSRTVPVLLDSSELSSQSRTELDAVLGYVRWLS